MAQLHDRYMMMIVMINKRILYLQHLLSARISEFQMSALKPTDKRTARFAIKIPALARTVHLCALNHSYNTSLFPFSLHRINRLSTYWLQTLFPMRYELFFVWIVN